MKESNSARNCTGVFAGLVFWLFLAVQSAFAHDFWMELSDYQPKVGAKVKVTLFVGENFKGNFVPRNPKLIQRFDQVSESGTRKVPGVDFITPAGITSFREEGTAAVLFQSNYSEVSLAPRAFEEYLREEGLESILALRAERGLQDQESTERFARYIKAFADVGGRRYSALYTKDFGMPLELRFVKDPILTPEKTSVELSYRGVPLVNTLIVASLKSNPNLKQSFRSDVQGRVLLDFTEKGLWLIKSVHMLAAPAESNLAWESHWAAITFNNQS